MEIDDFEYCWNLSITVATNIPNNKTDLTVWNKSNKICKVIEFSCPEDTNITSKAQNINMQIMYPDYQVQMIPIIVGTFDYVPKCLKSYMNNLCFIDKEIKIRINIMQCIVSEGMAKIFKTSLKVNC